MFPRLNAAMLPLWAIAGLPLVLAPAQAWTQGAAPASSSAAVSAGSRPDPADMKAPVPAAVYLSPLRAYQGFAEPQVAPWRDTNERVRQRGGWRAYAREASEPDAVPPAASGASRPAAASQPAASGHPGHGVK